MATKQFTDSDLQLIIGNVLRYGVFLSLGVSITGGIITFLTAPQQEVNYATFTEKNQNLFEVFNQIISGTLHGDGQSIIFLGILILFLTPALRLVLSLVSFIREKDWLYTFISLIVISIIVLSVSFGFSH